MEQFFTVTAWAAVLKFSEETGQPVDFGGLTYDKLTTDQMDQDTRDGATALRCQDCEANFIEATRVEEPEPEPEDDFVDLHDFEDDMML